MRISRPCYNKMHRCPGWAGPGLRYNREGHDWCDDGRLRRNGTLEGIYDGALWWARCNRCDTCDVIVLPYVVRWVDPRWLSYRTRNIAREVRYRIRIRRIRG